MGNRLARRAYKDAVEKRMISFIRKRRNFYEADREENEARVPLDEPVLWGYRRELLLREDVARRADAGKLLELLKVVQHVQDSRRKDFKRWNPDTRRWEEWVHRPAKVSRRRWEKLPQHLQGYFYKSWDRHQFVFRIQDPWMFTSRRYKLWITHRRIPDVELQQEISFLDQKWEQEFPGDSVFKVRSSKRHGRYDWCSKTRARQVVDGWYAAEIQEGWEAFAAGRLKEARGKEVIADA